MEKPRQDTGEALRELMKVFECQFGFVKLASEKIPFIIVSICVLMRAGVGSVSVRLEASTASASMTMAASRVCGRGPG